MWTRGRSLSVCRMDGVIQISSRLKYDTQPFFSKVGWLTEEEGKGRNEQKKGVFFSQSGGGGGTYFTLQRSTPDQCKIGALYLFYTAMIDTGSV